MTAYRCKQCNFRLNAMNALECPYCGRKTLEKERTAGELLDEVSSLLDEKA